MKTKITLSLLVVLFCTVSVFAQKKIMFVGSAAPANTDDALVMTKLTDQGFVVTYHGQADVAIASGALSNVAAAATFAASDAVVVSSSVAGGTLAPFATYCVGGTVGKPYLTWEPANYDEIGILSAYQGYTPRTVTATPNPTADTKFNGGLTTFDFATATFSLMTAKSSGLAAGAISIATAIAPSKLNAAVDTTIAVGVYLAKGQLDRNGAASGASVIAWNMFNNSNPSITNDGWQQFVRAVCVLAGKDYVVTGIKDIASYDVNAKIWYANGNLNMDIWKNLKNSQLNIYNTEGKMISKTQISGCGLISIPVSNLKSGLYMIVGEGFKGKFIKN